MKFHIEEKKEQNGAYTQVTVDRATFNAVTGRKPTITDFKVASSKTGEPVKIFSLQGKDGFVDLFVALKKTGTRTDNNGNEAQNYTNECYVLTADLEKVDFVPRDVLEMAF